MKTDGSTGSLRLLSVIIPTYKAEQFIAGNLTRIHKVLAAGRFPFEIICVIDGYTDKSYEKAKVVAKRLPEVKVVGYKNNLGKGYAVRFGMAQAKGDIIGFVDAGIELDPNGVGMLLEHMQWYKADIIIGSKRHSASKVVYPWMRRIMSIFYQILVRVLFGLKVRDTQVGMKFFRREVLEKTLPRLLVKKFAFDIEMLAVANYLGFSKIYEAPVALKMKFVGNSTIMTRKFFQVIFYMVWDTVAVFYRLRILHFYDYKNRKRWITPKYLTLPKVS